MLEAARLAAAALSVGFHVAIIFSGIIPALIVRPAHLALAMPFVFVFGPRGGRVSRIAGWVLCALGLASCGYVMAWRRDLVDQYGSLEGGLQHVVAVVLLLVVLDMARRAIKPVMPAIALIVLLYGLYGDLIPGEWGHGGMPLESFLGTLTITEGGIWGTLTATSAELVAPFMILGAFVAAGEAGTGFLTFAQKVAGRFRAGAAKVQVIASALYGMISGSASANVASTGTITIPTMIRQGYPRAFAAATEAVASTGGQIMPPIMGAGVFLMASLIQVPYSDLMIVAAPPAVLYFLTAWFGVHQTAVASGIEVATRESIPTWGAVARTLPFFLAPLGVLIVMLVASDYTAGYAGAVATAIAAALLLLDDRLRVSLRRFAARFREALIAAAEQIAMVASVIVCAGIITGVFHMTGVGVKITSLIVGLAGGQLWAVLALTALACIALGMELPTTAAYVICISVAGPALGNLGLPPLQAHLFVFWYALLCTLTPPVCGNVFIAASIAETPWLPVAWRAMRLGGGLFVVPLAFIAHPALLTFAATPLVTTLATIKVGIGLWFFTYALVGGRRHGLAGAALRLGAGALSAALMFAYGF
jgi:TRAP transporter 4TM/12TM fusion protein